MKYTIYILLILYIVFKMSGAIEARHEVPALVGIILFDMLVQSREGYRRKIVYDPQTDSVVRF